MKRSLPWVVSALLAASSAALAGVIVQSEQLNPADPAWTFKRIPRPSKSDLGAGAKVSAAGNPFEVAGGEGAVLVNGILPCDSLDLSEEALLSNASAQTGGIVLDLGKVQPVHGVAAYSWHEWDVDGGSRGPQVFTLYGSASAGADPNELLTWTKIAEVDTRPNRTGEKWNGQDGSFIHDANGKLGDFRRLLFLVQPTLSPRQPNPALTHTLFSEIDVHSTASLAKAGDATVIKPPPIEHVWVVFKTHLDIGYTDRIEEVLKKYRTSMMDGALNVVEASRNLPPEERFSWALAGWPLTHVLGFQQEPARRGRIAQAVRDGAITFHALPYTTHTETQDLEDLVRGLGYATSLAKHYGKALPIGAKMTDVPSHSWVMPTLLNHAGAKFLQIGCNDASAFAHVPPLFWWEGPDGSRVLCQYTRGYGSGLMPPRDWPSRHYLAMIMTGDNNGPPSPEDVERLRQEASRRLPGVTIHFATLDDFAKAVLAENPELKVIRADMPDTWIHGWLSMPVEAKMARNSRPLAPAVDVLQTQLATWGIATPALAPALAEIYEQSGLYSEHTFGPWGPKNGPWESGIPRRNLYGAEWKAAYAGGAYRKYEQGFDDKRAFAHRAKELVDREFSDRLDLLAKSVKAEGERIVVYNALPWQRSGVVEVPAQSGNFLYAEDVPANGYKTYPAKALKPAALQEVTSSPALNSRFYKVVFDLRRGGIASLVDKRTGRELIDQTSPYALGQFLHERFDYQHMLDFFLAYNRVPTPGQPAWDCFVKQDFPTNLPYAALTPTTWRLLHQRTPTADVAILTASDTLGLAKGFTLIFTLDRHQPFLDVEWRVTDKTPDPIPEGGWLCFPFAVDQPEFLLGRLGGPMNPAKDSVTGANRHYFCLNTGLTITGQDGAGIGLCPLDSPCVSLDQPGLWKHSSDFLPKRSSVFVNLYNNEWNTNFPEWQNGSWSSRVRLWLTGRKSDLASSLVVPSWEARLPLQAVAANGPPGKLPKSQAGLKLSRPGILVTAFGQNPDGAGTLLRLWEQAGQSGEVTVRLPAGFNVRTLQPVNLRGQATGQSMAVKGSQFQTRLGAYAPASFLLQP
ncbi:MAG TPA: hypothetical protein VN673_17985 [Clostridia bacterium]|nr:hypothetical protein [Clostridia bacterium]